MIFRFTRLRFVTVALGLFLICGPAAYAQNTQAVVLSINQAQTAGIDGRAWNASFPGALTVDAVHRSILVRFPTAAEEIKSKLDSGLTILRTELVLDYGDYEIAPPGYTSRHGLGEKKWKENLPQWHIVAWALRRPWIADTKQGPTFNAYISGAGYWAKYGAANLAKDRFSTRFGPAELSQAHPVARIDITPLLTEPIYTPDVGTRLRLIEENGLILKKLETYDVHYRDYWDAYEWAVPTGGHGLTFKNPKLVVTFNPDRASSPKKTLIKLPAKIDIGRWVRDSEPTTLGENQPQLCLRRISLPN